MVNLPELNDKNLRWKIVSTRYSLKYPLTIKLQKRWGGLFWRSVGEAISQATDYNVEDTAHTIAYDYLKSLQADPARYVRVYPSNPKSGE